MKPTLDYLEQIDPAQRVNDVHFEKAFSTAPHSSYELEAYICYLVSQGDLDGFQQFLAASESAGLFLTMGNLSKNPVRQMQYFTVASITLICRTAIAGGMNETAAYELSDAIIQRADTRRTPEDVAEVLLEGVKRYIEAVHSLHTTGTGNPHIRKALVHIGEHIYEKISLDVLAQELSLNKSYLCKLFKKDTGMTLTDYIYEQKIKQAKRLLLEETYPLSEIGTFLGFPSQSYFIQIFKRVTGTTPSRWLAEH